VTIDSQSDFKYLVYCSLSALFYDLICDISFLCFNLNEACYFVLLEHA
jgi:hypothetical protein